jgi:hypothetical protein
MVHARIYYVGAPSERTPRNAVAVVSLAVVGVRRGILLISASKPFATSRSSPSTKLQRKRVETFKCSDTNSNLQFYFQGE